MNKLPKALLYSALIFSLAPQAHAANIEMNTAHIQAMDKITGRVSELNIPVNGLANFGTFSILVRKCVTKSPEETPENTAFIDVVDNYKSATPVNIFKGWMFSSTPGINGVEHPIYDIWLLRCYNSDAENHQVLSVEQLKFRDEIPMVRQENKAPIIELSALDNDEETTEVVTDEMPETKTDVETVAKTELEVETQNDKQNTSDEEEIIEEIILTDEKIFSEPIVIDNEIVAQDEEQQKALEAEREAQKAENQTEETKTEAE